MAVAAAIGVGADDDLDIGLGGQDVTRNNRLIHNRLKMQHVGGLVGSSFPSSTSTAVLGDINRSIEKMSIHGGHVTTSLAKTVSSSNQHNQSMQRRDSNWTNSTEGYGSMRSSGIEQSSNGRRCSEVSGMSHTSNFSTTAVRNSPWTGGDVVGAMSTCSSRRSSLVGGGNNGASLVGAGGGGGISGHLSRLQQKAENVSTSSPVPPAHHNGVVGGRVSAMSECSLPPPPSYQHHQYQVQQQQQQEGSTRRASDPVRMLDRNFGVGGQMSRGRSYTNLSQGAQQQQQQRVPLHGQQVHGAVMGQQQHNMMPGMPQQQQQQQTLHGSGIHNGNQQVQRTTMECCHRESATQ
jgi:hypothetical protein